MSVVSLPPIFELGNTLKFPRVFTLLPFNTRRVGLERHRASSGTKAGVPGLLTGRHVAVSDVHRIPLARCVQRSYDLVKRSPSAQPVRLSNKARALRDFEGSRANAGSSDRPRWDIVRTGTRAAWAPRLQERSSFACSGAHVPKYGWRHERRNRR